MLPPPKPLIPRTGSEVERPLVLGALEAWPFKAGIVCARAGSAPGAGAAVEDENEWFGGRGRFERGLEDRDGLFPVDKRPLCGRSAAF